MTLLGAYDPWLVALSIVLALAAAYAALTLGERVTHTQGWVRSFWLSGGAAAMGSGIWAMHFTGMLAFQLPVLLSYDVPAVALSLLAAVAASGSALVVVSQRVLSRRAWLSGGLVMGGGIAAMHYSGMAAMRMAAAVRWDLRIVGASLLVAVSASLLALWLVFHLRDLAAHRGQRRAAAALVMGVAVAGMHYTGMAAATFVLTKMPTPLRHQVTAARLGSGAIALIILLILSLTLALALVDRRFAAQRRALLESRTHLRTVVTHAPIILFALAPDGTITLSEGRGLAALGEQPGAEVGQSLFALYADAPELLAQARRALAGEGVTAICHVREIALEVRWTSLADLKGRPAGAIAVATDITARQRGEEAVRASEERYRRIVETAQEGILLLTPEGRITFANEALADLLGYTVAELLDTLAVSYVVPAERNAWRGQIGQRRVRQRKSNGVTLERKDGAPVWARLVTSPLIDDHGRYVGALGMISDISAARRAEEALRLSEARFRAISEHASDLVAILDQAGVFRYVGPSYERVLGYAPAMLEGHNAFEFAHPDDALTLAPGFAPFVATRGATMRTEGRARHVDGSWHVMEMMFYNRLDDPAIQGIIVNSHDITARVRLQRDLDEGQQRYRSLFAQHPDAVFALGLDGALTSANAACAILSGYTIEELLTLSFPTLIVPEDLERIGAHFLRAIGGEPQHDVTLGLRRKDGDDRAVSITAIPIVVDGAIVGVYGIAKDVTAHNAAQQALRRQATHDALTDLPNRGQLRDRLAHAWATGASPALLLLDLDGFKDVNDTFGHDQGDALLREVALRLRSVVRGGDTVARVGGDEFAVALPGADIAGAEGVASALRAALDAPIQIRGHALQVGASIGIALAPVTDAADDAALDTLVRHADVAMYAAKRGRLGQQVYDPALDSYSPARLGLIVELRAAIAAGGLALHYQPQADLVSGQVRGVEALVRWPHAQRGLILPDKFIPLAEQTGLIASLTDWVLGEAIRQCGVWQCAGLALSVSVNLSVWNLHDPALPHRIATLLRAHAVPPSSLHLEVTETMLMSDPERALTVLTRLSAMGVSLAVDDFGAGYSSLAYLKTLPVDELKIDKGFVRELAGDATDAAIVASTIGLGHALGLRVVAEGIEDHESWDRLVGMGCDIAQGYYLSRPLPPDALAGWMQGAPWAVA